ncbi:hypothetical protein ACPV30_16615 [Photobacterium damselae]|uniref:hypothetical protein n=1 Tax=Photobacterium damselae TaxID=38293 RepID=UPI004068F777
MKKAVTIDEMKNAVKIVFRECGGNLPLEFKIRDKVEEIYGKQVTEQHPEIKGFQGAYLPRRGHVLFACSNILYYERGEGGCEGGDGARREGESINQQGVEAAIKVVRHEVLGHYALNTCKEEQKKAYLTKYLLTKTNQVFWLYGKRYS